jgi:retron-type reverse transcriptase
VGRIVEAYLCSYSFYDNVLVENEKMMQENPPKRFEAPKRELFIARGCYDAQEFEASHSKIGIPQGGALSGLISNIVLNTVDHECGLDVPNSNKFFCRYGDDILLMHTSKSECQRLISLYCETLTKYKLLYHEFISVANSEFRRKDNGVRPLLWDQKSRSPFLWGRDDDEPESVDWIGFLGYEIRYTGEVRLRRSSLNDRLRSVKRKYYSCKQSQLASGELSFNNLTALTTRVEKRIDRFAGKGFSEAKSLNVNKYVTTQALKLNKYTSRHLYKVLYKIAIRNNAIAELPSWWQYAKEKGAMNYLRTINRDKKG